MGTSFSHLSRPFVLYHSHECECVSLHPLENPLSRPFIFTSTIHFASISPLTTEIIAFIIIVDKHTCLQLYRLLSGFVIHYVKY